MNGIVLLNQLLVLLALMATGFIAYKTNLLDDKAHAKLSSFLIWVLNPILLLDGVIGKDKTVSGTLLWQNVVLVSLLYLCFFLLGFVYIFFFKCKGKEAYMYRMIVLFPNVGFMGIPLVKELFGSEYIVLVAFYMFAFNVLCYTYGVRLAQKMGGTKEKINLKKLINPGTVGSVLAILIFFLHIPIPGPAVSYLDYMGDTTIAISMIVVGISLAQVDWKVGFNSPKYYIFLLVDMFVFPLILVLLSKLLPFDENVLGVFKIMACMPVGSLTCMISKEYGGDGNEVAKYIALSTLTTVISAPVVIWVSSLL